MTDNRKQIEYRRNKYSNQNTKSSKNFDANKNRKDVQKDKEQKSIFRKILEVLSSIFAIIVILASVFVLVFRVILKVEVVKIFGYSGLIVLTGSMEPTYHPGDIVIIKEQKSYNVKDVITFHDKGMIVTHRIVEKDGEKYITKGDANNSKDPAIGIDVIEGKVIKRIPKLGNVILFLQKPLGIITVVVILLSLEVFFAARRKMVER